MLLNFFIKELQTEENTGKLFASRSLCSCNISVFPLKCWAVCHQLIILLLPPSVVSSALQRVSNYISQTFLRFLVLSWSPPTKERCFHEIRKAEKRRGHPSSVAAAGRSVGRQQTQALQKLQVTCSACYQQPSRSLRPTGIRAAS